MGPEGKTVASKTAREEAEEKQFKAACEAFPGWRIREVFGGYEAVPVDAVIVHATDLDELVGKLRQQGSEP